MGDIAFATHLKAVKGRDNPENWNSLKSIVGELIRDDSSLRGDLAHQFLYFQSASSVSKMSMRELTLAVLDFQNELLELSNGAVEEIKNDQTVRKFIMRQSDTIVSPERYLNLVLFLVCAAAEDSEKFFGHYTFNEIGGLGQLLSRLHATMNEPLPTLSSMIRAVDEFRKIRPSSKTVKHELGGMMELGSGDPQLLWSIVFRKTAAEILSYGGGPSFEKYYICYRYSSFEDADRIVKSFLVLQSPGHQREHFAFKLFYKSGSGQIRKSAGAILALGNTVTCFGSSRMLLEGDEFGGLEGDLNQVLGPKSVVLDSMALRSDETLVPGHLLSVNENELPISSKMVCVKTPIRHSSDAAIGSLKISSCVDELGKYTVLGDGQDRAQNIDQRSQIWNFLLGKMQLENARHTVVGLTKRDMDLRFVSEN